jgi:hypothetical protein
MAYPNNNSRLRQEIKEIAGLSELTGVPNQISESILPVIQLNNRKIDTTKRHYAQNTVGGTILSGIPLGKKFMVCCASCAFIKDASSTATSITMYVTISGQTNYILTIPTLSLTAQSGNQTICFPVPIELKSGDGAGIASDTNVAEIAYSGILYGYYEDIVGA